MFFVNSQTLFVVEKQVLNDDIKLFGTQMFVLLHSFDNMKSLLRNLVMESKNYRFYRIFRIIRIRIPGKEKE